MSREPRQLNALKFPMATGTAISGFAMLSTFIFANTAGYVLFNLGLISSQNARSLNAMLSIVPLWLITVILLFYRKFTTRRAAIRTAQPGQSNGILPELSRQATSRAIDLARKVRIPVPQVHFDAAAAETYVDGIGRPWRLVLDLMSLQALRRKPVRFDAVVVHELAHIASGDAFRRALSEALLRAIYLLMIAWAILVLKAYVLQVYNMVGWYPASSQYRHLLELYIIVFVYGFFEHLIPLALCMLFIRFIYAYLLRRQELVADWFSSTAGFHAGTVEYLTIQKSDNISLYQRLMGFHPSIQLRLEALRTSPLQRIPLVEFFLFGLLSASYSGWLQDNFVETFRTMSRSDTFFDAYAHFVERGEIFSFLASSVFYVYLISAIFTTFTPFAIETWVHHGGKLHALGPLLCRSSVCAVFYLLGLTFQPYFWSGYYFLQEDNQVHFHVPNLVIVLKLVQGNFLQLLFCLLTLAAAGLITRDSLRRPLRSFSTRVVVNGIYFVTCIGVVGNVIVNLSNLAGITNLLSILHTPAALNTTPNIVLIILAINVIMFTLATFGRRLLLGRRNQSFAAWQNDSNLVVETPGS